MQEKQFLKIAISLIADFYVPHGALAYKRSIALPLSK